MAFMVTMNLPTVDCFIHLNSNETLTRRCYVKTAFLIFFQNSQVNAYAGVPF